LLGEGPRPFPASARGLRAMTLNRVETLEHGVVRLDYGLDYRPVRKPPACPRPASLASCGSMAIQT
jgi:hypothetical protein